MSGAGAGRDAMGDADRIELRGLRVAGRVGLHDLERAQDQPLEIDLDLVVDLGPAGASDDLADTVDYGAVCGRVASTVAERHVDLLEHLTARVADAVLALDDRIAAVDVTVRKLRPPVPQHLATSGVHIVRSRS
ncbi:MAG TPA: dihydroneopterin aldolase [Acidimicrobiales bacterium]